MSRGVSGRRQRTNTWRIKTNDKMCNLEKIRSEYFLNIYIYKGIFVNQSLAGIGIHRYG